MNKVKLAKRIFLVIFTLSIFFIIYANILINKSSSLKTYKSLNDIPKKNVGLLLGCIKILKNGRINLYYKYRLEATKSLYFAKKINYILISGDNSTQNYDEPTDMKDDLIAMGIPPEKIYCDYAGFRTLDSIIRSNKVFLLNDYTIISQEFHNSRALYIAEHLNINAIAFNAKNVSLRKNIKTQCREYLAKAWTILDVNIFNTQPRFLGPTIKIGIDPPI